jgi:nitrate/TMAO reductase-like tetraheme cytochrome c subunit
MLALPPVVYGEIALAALLLLLVLVKPAIVRSLEGKVLLLIALFLAPAIAAYGGVTEHVERSRTTGYCLSCHVMGDYGKSLRADDPAAIPASHYQNNRVPRDHACISCHMGYGLSGDHRAIARFTRSAFRTYLGAVPEKIRLARRHKNRDCLRCHAGARSFETSAAHQEGAGPLVSLAAIKSGKISCARSGCHNLVHDVRELAAASPGTPAATPGTPVPAAPAAPGKAPIDSAKAFPPLPGPSPRSGS